MEYHLTIRKSLEFHKKDCKKHFWRLTLYLMQQAEDYLEYKQKYTIRYQARHP